MNFFWTFLSLRGYRFCFGPDGMTSEGALGYRVSSGVDERPMVNHRAMNEQ